MNTNVWMKKFLAILGSALMGLTLTTGANAANPEQVPVEVTFATAITIVENNPLQIGVLDVLMAVSDTVTINTDDSFTESASNVIGGAQALRYAGSESGVLQFGTVHQVRHCGQTHQIHRTIAAVNAILR